MSWLKAGACLAFLSCGLFAQEQSDAAPCRPLAPEDTAGTPPAVRATPYCSPAAPVTCEVALVYLDQLASRVQRTKDPYLVVVGRLGGGEKSAKLGRRRLRSVKARLSGYLPETTIVTAVGERVKGHGRLEFYVGGRLLYVLPYPRNANVDCGRVG